MRSHFASVLFLALAACASDSDGITTGELETSPDPTATYRAVVSFTSVGTGIDTEVEADVLALVNTYDIDLSPELHDWGLEGERNFCFTLRGLNEQAQEIFVGKLQEVSASSTLVFVYENARCDTLGE